MEIAHLLARVEDDPWGDQTGFSADIVEAHDAIFAADTDENRAHVLSKWLSLPAAPALLIAAAVAVVA